MPVLGDPACVNSFIYPLIPSQSYNSISAFKATAQAEIYNFPLPPRLSTITPFLSDPSMHMHFTIFSDRIISLPSHHHSYSLSHYPS